MSNKQAKELKPCPIKMVEIYSGRDEKWKGWHNLIENAEAGHPYAGPLTPEESKPFLEMIERWNENDRTNTDLEEAQAQMRALTEVLNDVWNQFWNPDGQNPVLDESEVAESVEQALSSPPIELYKAGRAVIDAVMRPYSLGARASGELLLAKSNLQQLKQINTTVEADRLNGGE